MNVSRSGSALPSVQTLPEEVLLPLCAPLSNQADSILELYSMTQEGIHHPGRCLRCFYKLREAAARHRKAAMALQPLQRWIEDHFEVVASGNDDPAVIRFLPVDLRQPTLENFCQEMIQNTRDAGDGMVFRTQSSVTIEVRMKHAVAA